MPRPKAKSLRPLPPSARRAWGPIALLGLIGLLGLTDCRCRASKLFEAAQDFVDFSQGDERVTDPLGHQAKKPYQVRHWQEEYVNDRNRALVDIEVPFGIGRQQLEKLLRDAVHDDQLLRSTSAVMVRAWPGQLERLAAPLGIGIFARDGHGWDGRGVGFEQIHVFVPAAGRADARSRPLSEQEYLMLLGVENMLQRNGDMLQAQQLTAERHEVDLEDVQAACLRGARLAQWLKAQAESALHPVE